VGICQICEEFELVQYESHKEIFYDGLSTVLMLEYSHCPLCGEQCSREQTKRNDKRILDWRQGIEDQR